MGAYLFPGQAAQFIGMGNNLIQSSAEAKDILQLADEVLGLNLSEVMSQGPEETLKETKYTQPAVFVHSYMVFNHRFNQGLEMSAVAGHSLGELTALVAAGSLSFEDGLKLVKVRAEAMQEACDTNPGTMAAILGMEDHVVEEICANIDHIVVAANYNCPGQLVISGSKKGIDEAILKCQEAGARRALEIAVGGAFHSPLMEPAIERFAAAVEGTRFSKPRVPVYQNVDAQAHMNVDNIKSNLIHQVISPVRWTQSIQNMIHDGHSSFTEVGGKGRVLMGMLRKISREISVEIWGRMSLELIRNFNFSKSPPQ